MDAELIERHVREAFSRLDSDGRGGISTVALERLLEALGLRGEDVLACCLNAAVDRATGTVCCDRFLDWIFAPNGATPRNQLGGPEVGAAAAAPPPPLPPPPPGAACRPPVVEDARGPQKCVAPAADPGVPDLRMGSGSRPALPDDGPSNAAWREVLAAEFGASPTPIGDTAERGITLRQLLRVLAFCERMCGRWHDTAPPKLSRTSGMQLAMGFLNLYHVNDWVVKPSTWARPCGGAKSCAFVELLASGPQRPFWYVSHWWGEPVGQFAKCMEHHVAQRMLGEHAPFWVCAYANRQHALGQELATDPTHTSFFRAMQLCRGVLLVVDSQVEKSAPAMVFRRMWVQFEEAMAFRLADAGDFRLDIATISEGEAQLLADGVTESDQARKLLAASRKTSRERSFPIAVMAAALHVRLLEAEASHQEDRRRILNCVAGLPLEAPPPQAHEAFVQADRRLHSLFAVAAWPQAAAKGLVTEMGLPEALAADAWRKRLLLDLSRCESLQDTAELARGVAGLRALSDLHLILSSCRRLENIDDLSLALAGLQSLERLDLHLGCCDQLCSVDQLGRSLPALPALHSVELHFEGCGHLADLTELQRGFAQLNRLRYLRLFFHGCVSARNAHELGHALAGKSALEELNLVFAGCRHITSVQDLGRGLAGLSSLRQLTLNFSSCEHLANLDELGVGLAGLKTAPLEHLSLGLVHCTGLRSVACMAQGIAELGGSLEHLSLWLKGCARMAGGAEELAQALPRLKALGGLELNLGDCRGLPTTGMRGLVQALAALAPPPRLELELTGCALPEPRLRRRFASHAEFCAEVSGTAFV